MSGTYTDATSSEVLLAKRDSCANPKNKNIAGEQMTSSVGGERDDLGFDSDLVDSLVSQLEAASDDDSGNEAEHGTNHSQWPTIRYAAIMTRVHHFVKEKQRVQSYLADEVAKAESELDNGDGSQKRVAPDGNIELYSMEQQLKRRAHRKNYEFQSIAHRIWDAMRLERVPGGEEGSTAVVSGALEVEPGFDPSADGVDKATFVNLMIKIHFLIICPPVDRELAEKNACDDWTKDIVKGGPIMNYELFFDSIFELVDIWTETSEAEEYNALAFMILEGITTTEREGAEKLAEAAAKGGATDKATSVVRLKADDKIVYEPNFTKQPVYMEDLKQENDVEENETSVVDNGGGENNEGEEKKGGGENTGSGEGGRSSADAGPERLSGLPKNTPGRQRMRRAMHKRRFKGRKFVSEDAHDWVGRTEATATISSLTSPRRTPHSFQLLSIERLNATIAKVYRSKMQVDQKMLKRGGNLWWIDKCRRQRAQRMDRFVLQYHIRQFGTKKLARRSVHQLCKSVTRQARHHPRIQVFAELIGVRTMVQKKPYIEHMNEFQPFACSDFLIPLLTKLCPDEEKLDRWMGNAKVPVTVTMSDFMQAVKEVGMLADGLNKRCKQESSNKPSAGRPRIDLDEGLVTAVPMWVAEEEYLIMQVTLQAIGLLKRWMKRARGELMVARDRDEHVKPHARRKSSKGQGSHRSKRDSSPPKTKRRSKRGSKRASNSKQNQPLLQSASSSEVLTQSLSGTSGVAAAGTADDGATVSTTPPTEAPILLTATMKPSCGEAEDERQHSARIRQRLAQAKELDTEVSTNEAEQRGG